MKETNQWAPGDLCLWLDLMRSILGTHVCCRWGDHSRVSCFSSESYSSSSFFFNLFNDNSGLWWGFNPALSSLISPWSLFKRSLIFLKSDSRVPATFLPGVLRAPKPFPFAQGTCFSAHFLLSLREWFPLRVLWLAAVGKEESEQFGSKTWYMKSGLKVKMCYTFLRASWRWPAGSWFTAKETWIYCLFL